MILKICKRPSYYIDNVRGKEQRFSNGIYTINQDLIRISECNGITATVFDKEFIDYHGDVYDLTLERNHIMYIRRNGKCFWGSNCRCHTVSILSTEAEFIEQQKAILEGREVPMKSKNEVTKIPLQMERWLKENEERIENAKAKPLWMIENRNFINIQS